MIHQPLGGVQGQATDIEIQAREICGCARSSTASWCTTPARRWSRITKDTDRDFFMTAEQAKEYRIVDEVISSKPTRGPVSDGGGGGPVARPWPARARGGQRAAR